MYRFYIGWAEVVVQQTSVPNLDIAASHILLSNTDITYFLGTCDFHSYLT